MESISEIKQQNKYFGYLYPLNKVNSTKNVDGSDHIDNINDEPIEDFNDAVKIPLKTKNIIGRHHNCDICIDDLKISRFNAILCRNKDKRVEIIRLPKTSEIHVNDSAIESSTFLNNGDVINLNDEKFKLHLYETPEVITFDKTYGRLIVVKGDLDGSRFPLKTSCCLIGSSNDCDIRITLDDISLYECYLHYQEEYLPYLIKFNSETKIYVNDNVIDEIIQLQSNDIIKIGSRCFRFEANISDLKTDYKLLNLLEKKLSSEHKANDVTLNEKANGNLDNHIENDISIESPIKEDNVIDTSENTVTEEKNIKTIENDMDIKEKEENFTTENGSDDISLKSKNDDEILSEEKEEITDDKSDEKIEINEIENNVDKEENEKPEINETNSNEADKEIEQIDLSKDESTEENEIPDVLEETIDDKPDILEAELSEKEIDENTIEEKECKEEEEKEITENEEKNESIINELDNSLIKDNDEENKGSEHVLDEMKDNEYIEEINENKKVEDNLDNTNNELKETKCSISNDEKNESSSDAVNEDRPIETEEKDKDTNVDEILVDEKEKEEGEKEIIESVDVEEETNKDEEKISNENKKEEIEPMVVENVEELKVDATPIKETATKMGLRSTRSTTVTKQTRERKAKQVKVVKKMDFDAPNSNDNDTDINKADEPKKKDESIVEDNKEDKELIKDTPATKRTTRRKVNDDTKQDFEDELQKSTRTRSRIAAGTLSAPASTTRTRATAKRRNVTYKDDDGDEDEESHEKVDDLIHEEIVPKTPKSTRTRQIKQDITTAELETPVKRTRTAKTESTPKPTPKETKKKTLVEPTEKKYNLRSRR